MHIFTHNVLEFTANISTSSKTIKYLQDCLYSNLMSFYRSFVSLSAGMSRVWWKSTVAGSRILRVNCLKLALTELRRQHEEQLRIYKEDIEKTYNSKVIEKSKREPPKDFSMRICIYPGAPC